jgi:hypothetical protein
VSAAEATVIIAQHARAERPVRHDDTQEREEELAEPHRPSQWARQPLVGLAVGPLIVLSAHSRESTRPRQQPGTAQNTPSMPCRGEFGRLLTCRPQQQDIRRGRIRHSPHRSFF